MPSMERWTSEDRQREMTLADLLNGKVCLVCNKRFSGPVPAEQHLRSEVHLRKVQQQSVQSTHPLWCSTCSLLCNSSQQYVTHCDSPRHQQMIQQIALIKQQQALTGVQTPFARGDRVLGEDQSSSLSDDLDSGLDIGESHHLQSSGASSPSCGFYPIDPPRPGGELSARMDASAEIPPGGVYFSNNRGHCYVCGIELTSLQHKAQHVEGKQHKKKALAFGGSGGGGEMGSLGATVGAGGGVMMCSICDVPLSGELNVMQHFSSNKHRQKKLENDHRKALSENPPNYPPPTSPVGTNGSFQTPVAMPESFGCLHGPNSMPGRPISTQATQVAGSTPQTYGHQSLAPTTALGSTHYASVTTAEGNTQYTTAENQSPESFKAEWLPAKEKGVCQMCNLEFQTVVQFSQHLVSSEHRQREEDMKKKSCDVCKVQYSGPASARQHLNSERHKKNITVAQLMASGNIAPDNTASPYAAASGEAYGTAAGVSSLPSSLTMSQLSHKLSNNFELEEEVKRLMLSRQSYASDTVPKVLQNSLQPSHFPPSPHVLPVPEDKMLNALDEGSGSPVPLTQLNIPPSFAGDRETGGQQLPMAPSSVPEYVFNGSRGVCNVCKIEFTSKSHAESHLAGAKHQKARLRWQPTATSLPGEGNDQVHAFGSATALPSAPNTSAASAPQEPPRGQQSFRFDGSRGYCFACKIELTSDAHAAQHLVGKKHQTATERWVLEGESCSYPLYCDVCYKPFTGQESAAQHFSSEKHKKKVALSEGVAAAKKDPDTGALVIVRDGQMWFMCEVCKCPLNTAEQFRLHVNSPKHNAELEKSKKQTGSNRSSPIDAGEGVPLNIPASTGLAVVAPDPSDLQHLVVRSSVKTMPGAFVPPPQSAQVGGIGLINTERGGAGMVKTEPGTFPPQGSGPRLSSSRSEGDVGSAFTGVRSSSEGGMVKREPGGSSSQWGGPGLTSGRIDGGGDIALRGQYENRLTQRGGNFTVQGIQSSRVVSHGVQGHHQPASSSSSLLQNGSLGSVCPSVAGQGGSGNRYNEGAFSELARGLDLRQISRSGSGSRGNKTSGQVLRIDGDYEHDDDDDNRRLPTSSSSSHYQDRDGEVGSAEDSPSMAMSSVQGGGQLSLTLEERRQGASFTSTTTDNNPVSIPTDAGSLAASGALRGIGDGMSDQQPPPPPEPNLFKGFRYACFLCKQPMNTKEDYDRHMKGLKHQMKAATVSAPDKSHERLVKEDKYKVSFHKAYECCKTTPRTYQVELMCRAMERDSTVIYLPTGTGKTLAAMMTVSRMLTLNPTRPVLFLVDKVLLVLQQARYIINELGQPRTFNRPHLTEENKMADRHLKVAVLCGGLSVRDATPLWKHDVIVTTAAFCQNLLQDKVLRWANFSMVVFDEAHHCTKNHPYNKLLSEHHLSLPTVQRPKVLGLTASPAGRPTKEETLTMLKELLHNLGGASIATIEEQISKEQLDTYSSSARLVPVCVPMTEAEMRFHEKLVSYFICAYVELMRCSNLQQICGRALQELMKTKPPNEDGISKFAQHLMSEPDELSEMVQLAQTARSKSNTVTANRFENIRMHVMTVGMTLLNSEDGIDFVLDDLERLFNPDLNKCFDELIEMGLPCKEVATYVNSLCDSAKLRTSEEGDRGEVGGEAGSGASSSMSIFQELLCTLSDAQYMSWDAQDSMALVLVRERKVAHKFKDHLKRTSFVRHRGMRVAVVVGHGAGSGEGEGMNLRKQDKVLQGIKSHRYNIVVATSVAEEGVDIPECQLVVCLNPPTTVKALVQMRGRARKKDSYFVVLCSSQREKEKLEDLQRQELNMKWAAAQLTQHNATQQ